MAWRRLQLYNELMESHTNRDKLFFKLVAAQRSTSSKRTPCIKSNNVLFTDKADILQAWANHFESLGRPLESPLFDNNYHTQVIEDLKIISSMSAEAEPPVFTPEEVATAVKSLHNNKAADPQGLMAEHLKMASPWPHKTGSVGRNK